MDAPAPPAHAWDWLARQRLPWREVHRRLVAEPAGRWPGAARYAEVDARSDVIALLRADYPHDETVRRTVDEVVAEIVFLGRTDVPFDTLGVANAPRGLRWWWARLTGEEVTTAERVDALAPAPPEQLALRVDDVLDGYGDPAR